jgi:hypothetical protein
MLFRPFGDLGRQEDEGRRLGIVGIVCRHGRARTTSEQGAGQ